MSKFDIRSLENESVKILYPQRLEEDIKLNNTARYKKADLEQDENQYKEE